MRRFPLALTALAIGGTACMTPDEGSIDEHLQRLDDLQVFEVGLMLDNAPEGSQNCYGLPCNDADEQAIANARAEQAARLADLVVVAEAAAAQPTDAQYEVEAACQSAEVERNLQALRDLNLIEVGALLEQEPENNPFCYNLPCQEDIDAAQAVTCERAATLAQVASDSQGL